MTDEEFDTDIEAGRRCVRCHALFAPADVRVTGGGIHPGTGLPQTRAIHDPPTCTPATGRDLPP